MLADKWTWGLKFCCLWCRKSPSGGQQLFLSKFACMLLWAWLQDQMIVSVCNKKVLSWAPSQLCGAKGLTAADFQRSRRDLIVLKEKISGWLFGSVHSADMLHPFKLTAAKEGWKLALLLYSLSRFPWFGTLVSLLKCIFFFSFIFTHSFDLLETLWVHLWRLNSSGFFCLKACMNFTNTGRKKKVFSKVANKKTKLFQTRTF